eukprot:4176586-Alexandrium_andersonii.AAC.1
MSASLVGSEMCIRDRRGSLGPRRRFRAAERVVLPGGAAASLGWVLRQADAVSYTHLTLPTICSV